MGPVFIAERLPTVEEYRRLRASVGWRALPEETMARGLAGSLFAACALAEGEVVGTGRVVGDGGVYFYLQDVMVVPAWQGRGVGRQVTAALMGWLTAHAPPEAWIGLMASAGKAGFYETFGFRRRTGDAPGMFRILSDPT
jgi:GNAT superfamily N-acetyltransferase